jgi:hypothetical protein
MKRAPLSQEAQAVYDGVSHYVSDKATALGPTLKLIGGAFLFSYLVYALGGWAIVVGSVLYGLVRYAWPAVVVLAFGALIFGCIPRGHEYVILGTLFGAVCAGSWWRYRRPRMSSGQRGKEA